MTSQRGIDMSFKLKEILSDVKGATAVEYGLIASLLVLAAIAGMNSLGASLSTLLGGVAETIWGILP